MPYYDKSGPYGMGPMTGRGMGPCGCGFGWGRSKGMGMGCCYGWGKPLSNKEQKEMLENYISNLEEELNAVKKELEDLK